MGMPGMEAMCAIRDGILPPPPLAKLIGFRMSSVEPGPDRDGTGRRPAIRKALFATAKAISQCTQLRPFP
jgi:hypothetical protein